MFTYPIMGGSSPLSDIKTGMLAHWHFWSDGGDQHSPPGPYPFDQTAGTPTHHSSPAVLGKSVNVGGGKYYYMNSGDAGAFKPGSNSFSCVAWAYPTAYTTSGGVTGCHNGTVGWSISQGTTDNTEWTMGRPSAAGGQLRLGAGTSVLNTWQFIAVSYDSATTTYSISKNAGTPVTGVSATPPGTPAYLFGLGRVLATQFVGYVDDTIYWDRLITQDEIVALYNGGAGVSYLNM